MANIGKTSLFNCIGGGLRNLTGTILDQHFTEETKSLSRRLSGLSLFGGSNGLINSWKSCF